MGRMCQLLCQCHCPLPGAPEQAGTNRDVCQSACQSPREQQPSSGVLVPRDARWCPPRSAVRAAVLHRALSIAQPAWQADIELEGSAIFSGHCHCSNEVHYPSLQTCPFCDPRPSRQQRGRWWGSLEPKLPKAAPASCLVVAQSQAAVCPHLFPH